MNNGFYSWLYLKQNKDNIGDAIGHTLEYYIHVENEDELPVTTETMELPGKANINLLSHLSC